MYEVLLTSQGFNKEEIEYLKAYTRDGDQDKLEKATKGLILRKNLVREEIAEEKNKEIDEL